MKVFGKIIGLACLWVALTSCGNVGAGQSSAVLSRLQVVGTQLMNESGDTVTLRGVSLGWHQFWPRFYNDSVVTYLTRHWGADVIRASMGVDLDSACYVFRPEFAMDCVVKVADAAIRNNVYVIIDWHSHTLRLEEAKKFFTEMATRYKGVPNVIYEVFNEPVEDSWEAVKSYSEEVIRIIRGIEPDAVILVGCPHWDQDIHLAAANPISNCINVMYTVHFYAATHGAWLRQRTEEAMQQGLPVFISECAGMEASGDGPVDREEWQAWLDWSDRHSLSWVAWSVSDKDETCSMLYPSASSTGFWRDEHLKEWGRMVRDELKKTDK